MRLLLRNKVGMSVLLTFLVLCLAAGAFALTGVGSAAHAAGTAVAPNNHGHGHGGGGGSGCDTKSNFYASPCAVTENTNGNVSFAEIGQRLVPQTVYKINSPSLWQACSYSSIGSTGYTVYSDFEGRLNSYDFADGCIRGTYAIELQETVSPFTVYSTHLTIRTP
jgi:hypothetical protein